MFLITCLGNPGKKYALNRHNVGFMFADYSISKKSGIVKKTLLYHHAKIKIGNTPCIVMKPQTYMNLSGDAVISIMNFFKIPIENCIIILDDAALPFGKIRIKPSGSSGGQNGLKHIISILGTTEIPRIRIGIGAPEHDIINHVLSDISKEQKKLLDKDIFPAIENALEIMLISAIDDAMCKYNGVDFCKE